MISMSGPAESTSSAPEQTDAEPFELSGGALCLDFINTLGDRPRAESEHLHSYGDLLRFSRQTESLAVADLDQLEELSRSCDGCVEPIFGRALELREALYRIFSQIAKGERADPTDLEILNETLRKALRQLELTVVDSTTSPGRFTWIWGGPEQALDRPLWPVARSAAELLTSRELGCVRECDSETCSWLFIDRSRNRSRRWCDMATCGNRAKARRHYRRTKRQS